MGLQGDIGPQGIPGPQGEQGLKGEKGDIGPTGPRGPQGEPGITGPKGPQGEKGNDGTSVTIQGYYDSYEELINAHQTGNPGNSYLVGDNLYVWSIETNSWQNVGLIRGPQGKTGEIGPMGPQGPQGVKGDVGPTGPQGEIGPQGIKGEQGPQGVPGPQGERGLQGVAGPQGSQGPQGIPGPLNIPTAIFITTSEDYPDGYEVLSDYPIPLELKTLDMNESFYLSPRNDSITFLKTGMYFIMFTVQAKTKKSNDDSNIISIGLRRLGEPTIYAACSTWGNNNNSSLIMGFGTVNIVTPDWYELVNTGKSPIIVEAPKIRNLSTESSLASTIVSIVIQKIK